MLGPSVTDPAGPWELSASSPFQLGPHLAEQVVWGEGQATQAGPWEVHVEVGALPFAGRLPPEASLSSVWLGWREAGQPLLSP